jgi:hypothetical protein
MKTLQTITTAIIFGLTSVISFGAEEDNTNNTNALSIIILENNSPSCNGAANGSISIEVKGGQSPYSYDWNTYPNQSTPTAINLSSGVYFIQVTDANGNRFFESIEVLDPNKSEILSTNKVSNIDLDLSVSGQNAPYRYELNGAPLHTEDLVELPVGIHQIKITDAVSCEMIQFIQIFEMESTSDENKKEGEQIKSKNDRKVHASNLIPTTIIPINEFDIYDENNLVILSDR